jgi:hypothetical protein
METRELVQDLLTNGKVISPHTLFFGQNKYPRLLIATKHDNAGFLAIHVFDVHSTAHVFDNSDLPRNLPANQWQKAIQDQTTRVNGQSKPLYEVSHCLYSEACLVLKEILKPEFPTLSHLKNTLNSPIIGNLAYFDPFEL